METIDINKVAGLQALDAEGNALGIISLENLTDMVASRMATELASQNTAIPAMQTMSLTASPAAASVSATGVDKTESQLIDVTDPGYVRVIDKTGNSGKQGIQQFAQVVGGLLDYAVSKTIKDCSLDDIDKAGFYAMDNSVTDIPDLASVSNPNATHWSLLVTKPYDGASVIQVIFTGPDDAYFKRYRYYGEGSVWSLWRKITPVIE